MFSQAQLNENLKNANTPNLGSTIKQNSVTNSVQTGVQTGTSSSRTSSNQSTSSDYMDAAGRSALTELINQLLGKSGDGRAQKYADARLREIKTNQAARQDYTKGNAFADAQNAMNANLAKALEQAMPTLTAGIDAAGTSGSAMQALLTQQAAENAARSAAELGLNAAISYGQIQAGFGDILERLTSEGDPVTNQLLQALNISKGSVEKTTSSGSQSTTGKESSISTVTGTETTNSTTKETPNKEKGSSGYQFQTFPGMSTPGYSKSSGLSATAKAQLEAARKQNGVSSSGGSSTYKGAYGF